MTIAPYLAWSALFLVYLSVQVIRRRIKYGAGLGDKGEEELTRFCRAQGNFTEYTPTILLLMACNEVQGAPDWLLHGLGALLVAGRIFHYYSLTIHEPRTQASGNIVIRFRQLGMALTFFALITGAVATLILYSGLI